MTSGAVAAAAALLVSASAASAQVPAPVAVFPIVGSRLASPSTQIAFRGVDPLLLGQVTVSGSLSGPHPGAVRGDSDGNGGSFLPARAFTPGETVTVRTPFDLVGAPSGTYQFKVAIPAGALPLGPPPVARRLRGDVMRFVTRPDLAPAAVRILKDSPATSAGDIFLTPQFGPLQNGPMILNARGQLLWFDPIQRGELASDLRVQSYRGQQVLTWWQGYTGAGAGDGRDLIYNSSYRQVASINAGNGLAADLHQFTITPSGAALITAYFPVRWNATAVHGPKQEVVLDSVVQEIDIPTGLVLYQWDSLDHVPLSASYSSLPKNRGSPFDYFHVNSAVLDGDGNLIVSARNTWAAYKVSIASGSILWTLGGKHSSFRIPPAASFAFQHDVEVRGAGDRYLSVFDDGAGPPRIQPQSRGMKLALNMKRMTVRLVGQELHLPALSANFEGNVQQLPDGHDFVGWGQQPYFSEFDSRGRLLLDGRFADATSSYRAFKFIWAADPPGAPAVASSTAGKITTVYVSWNGATAVDRWRVSSGASQNRLASAAVAHWAGFETAIRIPATRFVQVTALDAAGRTLGSSPIVKVR